MLGRHAQERVAKVAVLAQDVGVGVVVDVVRVAPLFAIAGNVPFEGLRVQRRVAGPVILAVHHVVTDFHVVQNLGVGQRHDPENPADGANAKVQQGPPAYLAGAADTDHLADMVDVTLADGVHHGFADGIDLLLEGVDLGAAQGGESGVCHGGALKKC